MLDFRESWLTCPKNAELLKGSEAALLQRIQKSPELRSLFLSQRPDGTIAFNSGAIDVYEAKVQEFLKRLLVLIHITTSQPLREPEFLSMAWCNTSRQRHIMI